MTFFHCPPPSCITYPPTTVLVSMFHKHRPSCWFHAVWETFRLRFLAPCVLVGLVRFGYVRFDWVWLFRCFFVFVLFLFLVCLFCWFGLVCLVGWSFRDPQAHGKHGVPAALHFVDLSSLLWGAENRRGEPSTPRGRVPKPLPGKGEPRGQPANPFFRVSNLGDLGGTKKRPTRVSGFPILSTYPKSRGDLFGPQNGQVFLSTSPETSLRRSSNKEHA